MEIAVRGAIPSDKESVLEFCKDTWPGGDYIQDVWDDWIVNRNGRLVVATIGGVPIGIAHASFQTQEVAWLEGIRVHPDYRGHGIAGKLNRALVRIVAQRGALVARLSTSISNKASQRHVEKVRFKKLASCERFEIRRGLNRKPDQVTRPRNYQAKTWDWLKVTVDFNRFHGMFSDGWTWYPITAGGMRQLYRRGQVLMTTQGHGPTSCSIFSSEDRRITLGFAVGTGTSIAEAIRYLRFLLSRQKAEKVRALVPRGTSLIRVLRDSGFERTGTVQVYEKKLAPKSARSETIPRKG